MSVPTKTSLLITSMADIKNGKYKPKTYIVFCHYGTRNVLLTIATVTSYNKQYAKRVLRNKLRIPKQVKLQ